jgi:hypothetical protein
MHAMNQITPTQTDHQSDEDLVTSSLPSDTPPLHPKLIPLVAANLRTKNNPEAEVITQAVVQAANDTLDNSISKKTSAYITIGCTIAGAVVTALSSAYSHTKC